MAAFDTSQVTPVAAAPGRIGGSVAVFFSRLTAWNDTRLARKSLSKLTDRELDDIGMCRGDIDIVAQGIRR